MRRSSSCLTLWAWSAAPAPSPKVMLRRPRFVFGGFSRRPALVSSTDRSTRRVPASRSDRERREGAKYVSSLKADFATLTGREKDAIGFVTAGLLSKQIAGEMGVSEVTVKMHRGNIMRKMHARSLADLVRMADLLGVTRGKIGSP